MAIDEEGMLWIAHYGGYSVGRWNPHNGRLLALHNHSHAGNVNADPNGIPLEPQSFLYRYRRRRCAEKQRADKVTSYNIPPI